MPCHRLLMTRSASAQLGAASHYAVRNCCLELSPAHLRLDKIEKIDPTFHLTHLMQLGWGNSTKRGGRGSSRCSLSVGISSWGSLR